MFKRQRAGYLIVAVILSVFYLFPFAIVLINSVKERIEVVKNPLALPSGFELTNYAEAWETMNYPLAIWNSTVVTVTTLAVLTIFPAMLAYYLARFETPIHEGDLQPVGRLDDHSVSGADDSVCQHLWSSRLAQQPNGLDFFLFGFWCESFDLSLLRIHQKHPDGVG